MSRGLPDACRDLVELQRGVLSREQAILGGMDAAVVGRLVRGGRWQSLQRGVYATFSGEAPREALLWAALHRAGPGAVLSHQTAAELARLTDGPSSLIHLTIPADRRASAVVNAIVHRSARVQLARHPGPLPPRTRTEETVLDLVQQSETFESALNWACSGCQRRLTTAQLILFAMDGRKKLRWRAELSSALADIGDGVHSVLEYRYVRLVERPHRLPAAVRQARIVRGTRTCYLDNLYPGYRVCVELDGRAAHPDERWWQDRHRGQRVGSGWPDHAQVQLDGRHTAAVLDRPAGRDDADPPGLAGLDAPVWPDLHCWRP